LKATWKKVETLGVGGVAYVVERLPSKHESLNSNSSTAKKKKRKRKTQLCKKPQCTCDLKAEQRTQKGRRGRRRWGWQM
jgi:hypothetical protein